MRTLKRTLIYAIVLAGLSGALCSADIASADHRRTIAYIGFSTDKPFWVKLGRAVSHEANRRNFDLIDLTPPNADPAFQTKLFKHALRTGVDGIIIGANHPDQLQDALELATRKDIPIVAIDTAIEHPAVLSLVATDNIQGAAIAGAYLVEKTAGKGAVLILGGTEYHPNGETRKNGVAQKVRAAGMPVIIRHADWDDEKAFSITYRELNRPNKISAIFACWDPGIDTASHVVSKLKIDRPLVLVGFDGLERTLDFIARGRVTATIAQDTKSMGESAVATLDKILTGSQYDKKILITPVLVDQSNIAQLHDGGD